MKLSKNLKSFISDSIIYTILNVINKAIPFILLPILVRTINTQDLGLYSFFLTTESVLMPIITLNIYAALSKHYYEDEISLKEYLSTVIISQLGLIIIFTLIISFIPSQVIQFSGIDKTYLLVATITTGILGIITLVSNFFRLERKPWFYGFYSITQSVLLLTLMILFAYWIPQFKSLLAGRLLFVIIFLLLTFLVLKRLDLFSLTFNRVWFKQALNFAIPTIFYSISALLFLSSDRFLIKYFLTTDDLGYYAAIFQLASVISILGMSLNAAWMPWLFENLKKQDKKIDIFIVKLSYLLMFSFVTLGFIFCLLYPTIASLVLPPQYHPYFHIAYPIIMGYAFEGIYLIVSPYIFYKGKTQYNGLIGVLVAIVNIALNIKLIPIIGISGAAYSTFCTWLLLALLFFIFSNRVYPMPWLFFIKNYKPV